MDWSEQIFAYCERAANPSFWAEPANALSNAAFLIAAGLAFWSLARQDSRGRGFEWLLVALLAAIGIGSFLFHTYATRWASVADTAPIGLFMIAYLGYAVRRFLGQSWLIVGLSLAVFLAAMRFAGHIPCVPGLLPITEAAGRPCFNGSLGYVPALAALAIVGVLLLIRAHPAGGLVTLAGMVFAISLVFRTTDFEVCAVTEVMGRARGTHAVWHVLNAVVLYLLASAAIRFGRWPAHEGGGAHDDGQGGGRTGIIRWS